MPDEPRADAVERVSRYHRRSKQLDGDSRVRAVPWSSYLLNVVRLSRLDSDGDVRGAVLRDDRRLPVSRAGYVRLKSLL